MVYMLLLGGLSMALAEEPAPPAATEGEEAPQEAEVPPAPEPVTYTLNNAKGGLWVLIKYDRTATIAGHDHVIQSNGYSGSVTWTHGDPSACKIAIDLPVSSLVVDPPGARARAGLEGDTSDGNKSKIKDNFLGKSQLDADHFGTITYRSTSCEGAGESVKVSGVLKIHGVEKALTTTMTITEDGSDFHATGSFQGTHADYGMEPFSALFGTLRNDPSLGFHIDVYGQP